MKKPPITDGGFPDIYRPVVFKDLDPFGMAGGLTYGLKGQFPHKGGWFPTYGRYGAGEKTFSFAGPDLRGGKYWSFQWWYNGGYHVMEYEYKDGKWVPVRHKSRVIEPVPFTGEGGKSGGGGATGTWDDEPEEERGTMEFDETLDPIIPTPDIVEAAGAEDSNDDSSDSSGWDFTAYDDPDDVEASNEVLGAEPTSVERPDLDLPTADPTEFWVVDGNNAYSSTGRTADYNSSLDRWEPNNGTSTSAYEMYMILTAFGNEPTWQSLPESGYNPPSGDQTDITTAELGLEDSEDLSEDDFYGNTPEE